MEYMTQRHWGLNGLHLPPSVHLCLTLRHTYPGSRSVSSKTAGSDYVANPTAPECFGPIYGMACWEMQHGQAGVELGWTYCMIVQLQCPKTSW
jgi:hypothetical protein